MEELQSVLSRIIVRRVPDSLISKLGKGRQKKGYTKVNFKSATLYMRHNKSNYDKLAREYPYYREEIRCATNVLIHTCLSKWCRRRHTDGLKTLEGWYDDHKRPKECRRVTT